MREYLVDAGGLRLSVRDHEGGDPVLVCLHGLASNARWWDLVARRLAPRHRLVAVDLRGHGRSDRPDTGYGFDEVSGDLRSLARVMGLPPAVWVGHSWGASVALSFAVAEPAATLGAVCVDGGVGDLREWFGSTWEAAEVAMAPPRLDGVTLEQLHRWAAGSPLAEGSDAGTATAILQGNFEEFAPGVYRPRLLRSRHMEIARHLWELDSRAMLAALTRPAELIVARSPDGFAASKRAGVDAAMAVLGGRGHATWIDGGHDLPVQRPDQVAAAIDRFVSTLARAG